MGPIKIRRCHNGSGRPSTPSNDLAGPQQFRGAYRSGNRLPAYRPRVFIHWRNGLNRACRCRFIRLANGRRTSRRFQIQCSSTFGIRAHLDTNRQHSARALQKQSSGHPQGYYTSQIDGYRYHCLCQGITVVRRWSTLTELGTRANGTEHDYYHGT